MSENKRVGEGGGMRTDRVFTSAMVTLLLIVSSLVVNLAVDFPGAAKVAGDVLRTSWMFSCGWLVGRVLLDIKPNGGNDE